jgi:hypothetical protein
MTRRKAHRLLDLLRRGPLGRGPLAVGLGLLVSCLTLAAPVAAAEPVPMLELSDGLPPPSARWNTLLIGTAVLGGFYGGAVAASYGWSEDPGAEDLRIPLVGPWLKLGQTTLCANLPESETPCSDPLQVVGGVLAVVSGIGQLGGVALLLEGTFMRTRAPGAKSATAWDGERLRLTQPSGWRRSHAPSFAVVPVLTPSTMGAFVTGTF